MKQLLHLFIGSAALSLAAAPALAGETVTYKYDALGRLIEANHVGTVNSGLKTEIAYDPAGNRTNYAVTGSSGPPGKKVVVVYIGGWYVIPIS